MHLWTSKLQVTALYGASLALSTILILPGCNALALNCEGYWHLVTSSIDEDRFPIPPGPPDPFSNGTYGEDIYFGKVIGTITIISFIAAASLASLAIILLILRRKRHL